MLSWHGCINFIVHYKLGELGETLRGQYRTKPQEDLCEVNH